MTATKLEKLHDNAKKRLAERLDKIRAMTKDGEELARATVARLKVEGFAAAWKSLNDRGATFEIIVSDAGVGRPISYYLRVDGDRACTGAWGRDGHGNNKLLWEAVERVEAASRIVGYALMEVSKRLDLRIENTIDEEFPGVRPEIA